MPTPASKTMRLSAGARSTTCCKGRSRARAISATRSSRRSAGGDASLRNEVSSLLAVHDAAPIDFLERPAVEEHGAAFHRWPRNTTAARPATRTVAARFVVYAAAAGIITGIVTGWRTRAFAGHSRDHCPGNSGGAPAGDRDPRPECQRRTELRSERSTIAGRPRSRRRSTCGPSQRTGRGRRASHPTEARRVRRVRRRATTSDIWITDLDGEYAPPHRQQRGQQRSAVESGRQAISIRQTHPTARIWPGSGLPAARAYDRISRRHTIPNDWLRDGSGLLVSEDAGSNRSTLSSSRRTGPRREPTRDGRTGDRRAYFTHGRWVAYASMIRAARKSMWIRTRIRAAASWSRGRRRDPVWRGDGRELYTGGTARWWRCRLMANRRPSADVRCGAGIVTTN